MTTSSTGLPSGQRQTALDLIADHAEVLPRAVLMAVSDRASAVCCSPVWRLHDGRLTLMHGKADLAFDGVEC